MLIICMLMWATQDQMRSPADQLLEALRSNQAAPFSSLELALIAGGATELEAKTKQYNALLDEMALSAKAATKSDEKQARELKKNLKKHVGVFVEASVSVLEVIDQKSCGPLAALFIYRDLLDKHNLSTDLTVGLKGKEFDPYFVDAPIDIDELLAAMFIQRALQMADFQTTDIYRSLEIAHRLAPETTYGAGTLDQLLYNRAFELFSTSQYRESAHVAAWSSAIYPQKEEFYALNFNLGVQVIKIADDSREFESVADLVASLYANSGPYKDQFKQAASVLQFNYAVFLSNEGQYWRAIEEARKVEVPPSQSELKNLILGAFDRLAQAAIEEGDDQSVAELIPQIAELDADRADKLLAKHEQLKLKRLSSGGDFAGALKVAAGDVNSETGFKNYESVLTRYVQHLWDEKDFEQALKVLDQVPQEIKASDQIPKLRVNSYVKWMDRYTDGDYRHHLPILRRAIKDRDLMADPVNKRDFYDSYGNALCLEVEQMLGDEKYLKAEEKNRQALKMVPNNKCLRDKADLIEVIKDRLGL